MSDAYTDGAAADGSTTDRWFNDQTLKRAGAAIAGAFTLAVGVLLYYIVDFADPNLFVRIIPRFLEAFVLVLGIVAGGSVLSIPLGIFVGLGRVSKTRFTNAISTGYVEFFRGTPLLFQLIVIYYGIPALWIQNFGDFPISNWAIPAAIIGLMLNHGAYVGEAIRGGIGAVPEGQMEAARSLGMSYVQAMREVILPQAWRNALAAIGNDQVILVKDTSLLTVIAVPELISEFRQVNSATFDPWTPIILVAILYLCITIPLGKFVRYLEARSDWGGGDRR